ncbi:hypothetical protein [Marinomonas sp. TW1]|uniref:hypothetical protein n=1 Tax=Marinomonas sp. TW1 TaxID=1561203 RepID=UPI0012E82A04|nr:hypothetical protein [Marinomonas sp. TW1]
MCIFHLQERADVQDLETRYWGFVVIIGVRDVLEPTVRELMLRGFFDWLHPNQRSFRCWSNAM